MRQIGEVVQAQDGKLVVAFERPEACQHCNGCLDKRCTRVELSADAKVGDRVEVEMPAQGLVKASMLAYLVPLGMLLLGIWLGMALHGSLGVGMDAELFGVLCGLALLALSYLLVRAIDRRLAARGVGWRPRVVRVLSPQECPGESAGREEA